MKYAKIIDDIVAQIQPNKQDGFIEVDDSVICGMVNSNGVFDEPELPITQYDKWQEFNRWESDLVVTITNGNKYGVNKSQRSAINEEMQLMNDEESVSWVESWGTQVTSKSDFAEALKEYKKNKDLKLQELGLI